MRGLLLSVILLLSPLLYAQPDSSNVTVEWRTSNLTPLLGEPVTVALVVTAPEGTIIAPTDFTSASGTIVVDSTARETTHNNNLLIYTQTLTFRLWELASLNIPPLTVEYTLPGTVQPAQIQTLSLVVEPRSILREGDQLLRPLPELVPLTAHTPNGIVFGAALFLLLMVVILLIWRYQRHTALARLSIAESLDILSKHRNDRADVRATAMVSHLRRYLREEYQLEPNVSTRELMDEIVKKELFQAPTRQDLERLLKRADRFIYSNITPPSHEVDRLLREAADWVRRKK